MSEVTEVRVSGAVALEEGRTTTFTASVPSSRGERRIEGFVLKREGELLAFLNECPHWSVELDLGDGHFYDEQLDRIYCKNHGALFVLPHGHCETGPCLGRSLTRYPIQLDGQDVVVLV